MKECSICKAKETPQWYADSTCKSCYRRKHREANKAQYDLRDKAQYEANKERVLQRQKRYYAKNTEKCKERTRNHKKVVGNQRRPGYMAEWREKNREHHNRYFRFANAKRRARILQATPIWLTDDHWAQIKEIYANCPAGYEVDHVLPLQGKEVTGLHVPWNLQYLPTMENRSKKNKVL